LLGSTRIISYILTISLNNEDIIGGRPTDEDGPDGEGETLLVDVGLVQVVEHAVQGRNVSVLVTDNGELEVSTSEVVYVLDPSVVRVDVVGG
jgi:hypothetical protein